MTKEAASVKVIMEVALRVHQKSIEYYEGLLNNEECEKMKEYYENALYNERISLKEVAYLIHEMEEEGLWE